MTLEHLEQLKQQYVREFKRVEARVATAEAALEFQYLREFCRQQEEGVIKTKEELGSEREKMAVHIKKLLETRAEASRLEFAEKLAVATYLLEEHLESKKNMEKEVAILKKLGQDEPLLAQLATSLEKQIDTKNGLERAQDLHAECHRVISQAKLASLLDRNTVYLLLITKIGICTILCELCPVLYLQTPRVPYKCARIREY